MCAPRFSSTCSILLLKPFRTFANISGVIVLNTSLIWSHMSSLVCGAAAYTRSLTYGQTKKSNGVRSGERGGHGCAVLREMTRRPNKRRRILRLPRVVCTRAPSCINHVVRRSGAGIQSLNSSSRNWPYFSAVSVPSKKWGPTIRSPTMPAQTLILKPRLGTSIFQHGFSGVHFRTFWRFIVPLFVKVDSSVNKILDGKLTSTSVFRVTHWANRIRFGRSSSRSSWWFWAW